MYQHVHLKLIQCYISVISQFLKEEFWVKSSTMSTSIYLSVQFSSVAQSCPTLCDPMNCSTPSLPVHHQLPEFTQIHTCTKCTE